MLPIPVNQTMTSFLRPMVVVVFWHTEANKSLTCPNRSSTRRDNRWAIPSPLLTQTGNYTHSLPLCVTSTENPLTQTIYWHRQPAHSLPLCLTQTDNPLTQTHIPLATTVTDKDRQSIPLTGTRTGHSNNSNSKLLTETDNPLTETYSPPKETDNPLTETDNLPTEKDN